MSDSPTGADRLATALDIFGEIFSAARVTYALGRLEELAPDLSEEHSIRVTQIALGTNAWGSPDVAAALKALQEANAEEAPE